MSGERLLEYTHNLSNSRASWFQSAPALGVLLLFPIMNSELPLASKPYGWAPCYLNPRVALTGSSMIAAQPTSVRQQGSSTSAISKSAILT